MRISDWSSDVCSSDLTNDGRLLASAVERLLDRHHVRVRRRLPQEGEDDVEALVRMVDDNVLGFDRGKAIAVMFPDSFGKTRRIGSELQVRPIEFDELREIADRSEEHTSELQSLMRISYAVFCLKKKKKNIKHSKIKT